MDAEEFIASLDQPLTMSPAELDYIEAAEALAKARVRFAEAFLAARVRLGKDGTDRQAEAHATAKTSGDVGIYEAELEVRKWRLRE